MPATDKVRVKIILFSKQFIYSKTKNKTLKNIEQSPTDLNRQNVICKIIIKETNPEVKQRVKLTL